MLYALFLVFCFVILITAKCPPGSIPFFSDKTLCLHFNATKTYYLEAEQACKDMGGHLTSVHNLVDNMYLSQEALSSKFIDDDFWFGANDLYSPQKWSWMDNTPFDFEDWDKGQPQNVSGSDCGAVIMLGGKWRAVDCFMQKPYVCTISALDAPSTIGLTTTTTVSPTTTSSTSLIPSTKRTTSSKPKSCPDSWTFYETTGFCYKIFIDNSTWLEAEERCKVDYAHLASIHNNNENNFVLQLATYNQSDYSCDLTKELWIGCYTEDENKEWEWTDGTPFDYNNWYTGQPDNQGIENCGQMIVSSHCYTPGQFNNYPCKSPLARFVCKLSP